jgi:hypothetical protein
VFGVILLLLLVSSLPNQTTSSAYDDAVAYEVYDAMLGSEWRMRVPNAKQLVLRRETKSFRMCLKPASELEAKFGPAIADYVKLNERKWLLQPKLSFSSLYEFLDPIKLDSFLGNEGWKEFYRQYPESGGIVEFSAVGFNADKTIAVVYMGRLCGPLCGMGAFYVLEKRDGKWKEIEWKGDSCAWIA